MSSRSKGRTSCNVLVRHTVKDAPTCPSQVVKSYGRLYDAKVADLWSAGVVLYIMLYGKYPYDLDDDVDIPESHRSAQMLERMESEKFALPSKWVGVKGAGGSMEAAGRGVGIGGVGEQVGLCCNASDNSLPSCPQKAKTVCKCKQQHREHGI